MHPVCLSLKHSHLRSVALASFILASPTALASCRAKDIWTSRKSINLLSRVRTERLSHSICTFLKDYALPLDQPPEKEAPHVPVMLKEVVAQFDCRRLLSFVDCTLGAGGHAAAIISAHAEMEMFLGLDVDPVAHAEAYPRLLSAMKSRPYSGSDSELKLQVKRMNFRNIKSALEDVNPRLACGGVDGILMDLGMSSMQVNEAHRGFSFMRDGPLDMRMDPTASLTAEVILNTWPEAEVGCILRDYGGERRWRYLARRIVEERLSGGISTTAQLVEIIGDSSYLRTKGKHGRLKPSLHPATRTFQALRIAVNDELKSLKLALSDAFNCLSSGGRLQVISFHSLEDRIVKHFFLDAAGLQRSSYEEIEANNPPVQPREEYTHIPGETRHNKYVRKNSFNNESTEDGERMKNVIEGRRAIILTKRPISPGVEDVSLNPRCRSAKLRVIEKKPIITT